MIPHRHIVAWRQEAEWVEDVQVEQDLLLSRAIIAIFSQPLLRDSLAFRGGTALYKLHLRPALRYSEDIDLVQTRPEPAGPMMTALREALDPWLGRPQWKQTEGRVTFAYRVKSSDTPPLDIRIKIEINTREHFTLYGYESVPFSVSSRWFDGACQVRSYALDELLGTKMRALYQRKQGRDLFDLAVALTRSEANPSRIVAAFQEYMRREGRAVTRAQFEQNLAEKLTNVGFASDIRPLLPALFNWDFHSEAPLISSRLIELLPGDPWQGGG